MIRTQVYLADHQFKAIKIKAQVTKRPEAEIIREALEIGLPQVKTKSKGNINGLQALIDLGKKYNINGPEDLSRRIDDYLYDDKE